METLRDIGQSLSTERVFWCHQCHLEFKLSKSINSVNCQKCNGDFCEEIFGEENDPRKFVPYTATVSNNNNPLPTTNQSSSHYQTGSINNNIGNNFMQGSRGMQANPFPQLNIGNFNFISSFLGGTVAPLNQNTSTVQITNFVVPNHQRMISQLFSAIFPNSPAFSVDNYLESALQHIMQNDPNAYGNPPASVKVVETLPTMKVDDDFFEKDGAKECTVCKDDFKIEEILKELPCKHRFHDACILPWLKQHNSCPTCRYELPTDDPDFEQRKRLRNSGASTNNTNPQVASTNPLINTSTVINNNPNLSSLPNGNASNNTSNSATSTNSLLNSNTSDTNSNNQGNPSQL